MKPSCLLLDLKITSKFHYCHLLGLLWDYEMTFIREVLIILQISFLFLLWMYSKIYWILFLHLLKWSYEFPPLISNYWKFYYMFLKYYINNATKQFWDNPSLVTVCYHFIYWGFGLLKFLHRWSIKVAYSNKMRVIFYLSIPGKYLYKIEIT